MAPLLHYWPLDRPGQITGRPLPGDRAACGFVATVAGTMPDNGIRCTDCAYLVRTGRVA